MSRTYKNTIVWFDRTPPGILCPHFYQLRWAFGCNYECQWCYLAGTSFGKKHFRAYPVEDTLRHVARAFEEIKEPAIFNSGELADSMPGHSHMRKIMDAFEGQRRHRLLLLTKSADVGQLVADAEAGRRTRTIYSCTVNAPAVAGRWERGAPDPHERLEALRRVIEAGMEGRCRIDPVVPVDGWQKHYDELAYEVASCAPGRVTIGTPRGLARTLNFAKKLGYDLSWAKYLSVGTGWGKKIPDETRREIYARLIDRLRSGGVREIGICKETADIAREFGMSERMKCNCVG